MKKTLSILLSLLVIFSMVSLSFSAFAAEESSVVLEGDVLDEAIVAAVAELADIPADSIEAVETKEEAKSVNAKDLAKELARCVFINIDEIDEYAEKIADEAEYKAVTLEDGKKTIYVSVDFRKNPEIANLDVFKASVKKINEKQNELAGDEEYSLMSYQHIAGELALHAIIAAYCSAFGVSEDNETFKQSIVAELNIDEKRVPTPVIEFIGKLIMNYIKFSFTSIFKKIF